jgi:hypothetical protein
MTKKPIVTPRSAPPRTGYVTPTRHDGYFGLLERDFGRALAEKDYQKAANALEVLFPTRPLAAIVHANDWANAISPDIEPSPAIDVRTAFIADYAKINPAGAVTAAYYCMINSRNGSRSAGIAFQHYESLLLDHPDLAQSSAEHRLVAIQVREVFARREGGEEYKRAEIAQRALNELKAAIPRPGMAKKDPPGPSKTD